jgi:hypothetical protein
MQYPDDDEISATGSTIAPLQGVAIQYRASLNNLVSFVHDRTYTKGELRAINPEHVIHRMNIKAFGVTDPPTDANPFW